MTVVRDVWIALYNIWSKFITKKFSQTVLTTAGQFRAVKSPVPNCFSLMKVARNLHVKFGLDWSYPHNCPAPWPYVLDLHQHGVYTVALGLVRIGLVTAFLQVATPVCYLPGLDGSCSYALQPKGTCKETVTKPMRTRPSATVYQFDSRPVLL